MVRALPLGQSPLYWCVRALRIAVVMGLVAVWLRLAGVQLLAHEQYRQAAENLTVRRTVLPAERGTICDRRGLELAADRPAINIYVRPAMLHDPWRTAVELGKALKQDPALIARDVADSKLTQAPIATNQDVSVESELEPTIEREGQGLCIEPVRRRVYPQGSVAADLIGFVGREQRGLEGLEHSMQHRLQGQPGLVVGEVDVFGEPIGHRGEILQKPRDGYALWLTIDAELQRACQAKLGEAVEGCGALGGYAIVMHAPTGRILAACDYPTFDLENWEQAGPDRWKPGFATWTFEPGSTLKPLVFAMALQDGVVSSNEAFHCDGTLKVADRTIRCHSPSGGHGRLDVSGVLRVSCNDATGQVGVRAGAKRLSRLFDDLGFTQSPTDEVQSQHQLLPGYLGPTWCATSAFGQGISITPLHLTAAYAALANGGRLVRPEFIEATVSSDGVREEREPAEGKRVFERQVADLICGYLVQAVEASDGTGRSAQVEGLSIAGKTGTAQVPSPAGGYLPDRYVVSFVGVFPAEKPEWVVSVVIDQPKSGDAWGGTIAAPAFREIATSVCRVLGVTGKPR